jgi:hypothetical protein
LEAAEARTIVEIGALRGENTRQMIDRLGPKTVLHVIDPLPDFDPEEHEREFAGQYVFHRDLSLNVLGDLPPMDAALVDGDHNWYTVYNELRLLREVARANDAPLPLLILHDVGWPYGRRDLYYDPENIPAEFRKEWAYKGMEPDKKVLVPFGAGLNPKLANAMVEGGRRNGVRTGLDDFVAEHDRPLRQVVLPIYFGLAIVAEEERLERQPALAAALDRLESSEGKDALLQVAEDIRIDHLIFQHRIYYDRDRSLVRLGRRYLSQVIDGWIGEAAGADTLGEVQDLLDELRTSYVRGDVAAVGLDSVAPGLFLRAYLDAFDLHGRHTWAFGAPAPRGGAEAFRAGLERLGLGDERVHLVELTDGGTPAGELPEQLAVLWVGDGLGSDPDRLLDALHARLSHGALLLVHPSASEPTRTAVEALKARVAERIEGDGVGPGGLGWRVAGSESNPVSGAEVAEEA